MKSSKLKKLIAVALVAMTVATVSPIGASAAWKQDSNGWWNTEGSSWSTGWRNIDNTWYYFGSDGYMKTGWVNDGGTWYYLAASGAMKTGWINDNGTWYYLQSSGAMKTGWTFDGSNWYYLAANGAMQTGWINDNGTWYYLNTVSDGTLGAMQTGVIEVNGKVYYFAPNGAMQTGTVTINGVTYTFAASGEAIGNKIPTPSKIFGTTPNKTTTDDKDDSSNGGGGSHHHSSGNTNNNVDTNNLSSSVYDKLKSDLQNHSAFSVASTGDSVVVTLNDTKLGSLKTVFDDANKTQDVSVIEAKLAKAEEIIDSNATMLNVGGVSFKQYLAKADAKYSTTGGTYNYFITDADGNASFNKTVIAQRIKDNTLTYDKLKQDLEARVFAMCDETKTAPEVTISDDTISAKVTTIQKDGKSVPVYDAKLSIKENIDGLVGLGLGNATTGTYTIYSGTQYFTVTVK